MLSTKDQTNLKKLFNSLNKNDEFEIMFNNFRNNNLSLNKFVNAVKFVKWKADKENLKIINQNILDIQYIDTQDKQSKTNTTYRISIEGNDNINNFLKLVHLRSNHIIYSILLTQFINDSNFKFIKKVKDATKIIDFNDFDIRFRVSSESPIDNKKINDLANLPISESEKIKFRYKNRISVILIESETENLSIDLTAAKLSDDVKNISKGLETFEIEIDYMNSSKLSEKTFQRILSETESIKKVLDESQIITQKGELDKVISRYKDLVFGPNNSNFTSLYSMQPISAEVQHIIDRIPNRYSVTDKADGDKYSLLIKDDSCYLISNNLIVKKLDKTIKGYNDTLLEGELIHITSVNKYIFMGFDCLFFKGEDMRSNMYLKDRLEKLREVSKKLTETKYVYKDFSIKSGSKYSYDDEKKFCQEEIENFYQNLNELISKVKVNDVIFHTKLFFFPLGATEAEVFLFSYLIWYNCTKNEKIKCPYLLDGIIYTGIEQKYTKDKREQKYPIYKYKPPEMNSLDVYIEFQANSFEKGGFLDIFDNSLPDEVENQYFRVTNFFVGDIVGTKETPVPFMKDADNNEAYLPISKGQVRDVEGNIIQNNTVVEVVYSNDLSVPHKYRWSVLRTRWDKTDSVLRHSKKYGNFKDIAERVWKSMIEAVTIKEIKNLSAEDTYFFQKKQLEARIDASVLVSDRKQDIYYQKTSNLAKPMRNFNNWVKSVLIYSYCQKTKVSKDSNIRKLKVLDIGCGRGGDMMKMYHARVGSYVGIDPDYETLFSAVNGAMSRYNANKKKFPDFTNMTFIHADANSLLNEKDQIKSLPKMPQENKKLIKDVFSKKNQFDVINSSFAIHYLFGTKLTTNNLIENINNNLSIGGFIICELFDADKVMKLLDGKDKYTSYYTDEDGNKMKFFEIIKKFKGELENKPGLPIDVYMSWISEEGTYFEEYLVTKKFMVDSMKKAGCYLVDSDLFSNVFELNKDYFDKVIKFEENQRNKKFYYDVAKFYDDLKGVDKESKTYCFLNRYYIFKKIE